MSNIHKELIAHLYIMGLIKSAIAEQRHFYTRKKNQNEFSETEISVLNISETNFYFVCSNPEKLDIHEQEELIINFSVRQNDRLLPCELKVCVTRFRISNGTLFFATTFPISVNHMQRRLFVRYPIKTHYFQQLALSFTNRDYPLAEYWQPFDPNCISWGDISIGGIMFYLKKHDCWEKDFTNKSTLILNCTFNYTSTTFNYPQMMPNNNPTNMFHIACEILEMQNTRETNLKFIRARFANWTYQKQINWKKIPNNQALEAFAKYLFQYAYQNKITTN